MKLGIIIFSALILSIADCGLLTCWADVFSSNDLIKDAKKWDGYKVTYRGEAVAAVMDRGAFSWVNLNDGDNAIGVWCSSKLLAKTKFLGDYKTAGDVLEVEGKFHRACPMHGGDLDIHAYSVRIVKSGYRIPEEIDTLRANVSAVLFLLIIASVIIFKKRT
jgi:hypothetical protein